MASWFVVHGGDEQGPVTAGQLKEMAATGKLLPGDLVRREDMQAPREASTIKGLFSSDGRSSSPATPASSTEPSEEGQKAKRPASKKMLLILSGVAGACLLLCCGGFGVLVTVFMKEQRAAQRELAEADALWQSGDKAAAATKYRAILQTSKRATLEDEQKALAYGRLIDFEVESGNTDAAKQLLAEAGSNKVTPTVNQPKARALVAAQHASSTPPGGRAPDGQKGDGLTADFLPCIAGNVKRYEEERYDASSGKVLVKTTDKETYLKDNAISLEWTTSSPGQPPTSGKGQLRLQEKNGVIEREGRVAIKLGAKPGDEWPNPRGKGTYKLVRFEKAEAKGEGGKTIELVRAVVEFRLPPAGGRGDEYLTEYVLERGGGIQSEKDYTVSSGKKVLTRHRRLISSTYP